MEINRNTGTYNAGSIQHPVLTCPKLVRDSNRCVILAPVICCQKTMAAAMRTMTRKSTTKPIQVALAVTTMREVPFFLP
jgi:uracil phosphoribosyltransferase